MRKPPLDRVARTVLASFCVLSASVYPLASCASGGDDGNNADSDASTPPVQGDSAGATDAPTANRDAPPPGPDSTSGMDAGTDSATTDAAADSAIGTDATDASPTIDAADATAVDAADAADAAVIVDAADATTVDAADAADAGIPSLGLVGQWLCSGNTNDTSGSGNNGTAAGGLTFTADRRGNASAACAFNGSNASVQIPSSTSLGVTTTWSLSAWVNPNSFSALAGIASKYQTNNAKGMAVRLANTSPYNGVDVNEASYITDAATGFLTASTWTHVGVTVNGLAVNCYINGSLAYASTAGYTTQTNSDPLVLGVDYANRFFNGAIDDVRLYNRVLSPGEIDALFLAP